MKTSRQNLTVRSIVAICFAIVVLAVVIVAITLLDSPAQERLRRLDERRMSDLREIANAIDVYWTEQGSLPSTLDDLADDRGYFAELVDPETGASYEYRVVDSDSYELCATFVTEEAAGDRDPYFKGLWHHGTGRQCFMLTAQDLKQFREVR
jgi:type II secretory pathway pseudopilin PulG